MKQTIKFDQNIVFLVHYKCRGSALKISRAIQLFTPTLIESLSVAKCKMCNFHVAITSFAIREEVVYWKRLFHYIIHSRVGSIHSQSENFFLKIYFSADKSPTFIG